MSCKLTRRNPRRSTVVRVVDFAREHPILIAMGVSTAIFASTGLYLALRGGTGDRIVVYTSVGRGDAEFRLVANRIAQRIGATVYPITNGQDLLNVIRRHRRIGRFILVGHGTATAFVRPGTAGLRRGADALPTWVGVQAFSRELGSRLTRGAVVGWAGCSSGANPGQTSWGAQSYGSCGHESLVANVRDTMARVPGIASGIEHRAHTAPGHASGNPAGRIFRVDTRQVGRCGSSLLDERWGSGAHQSTATRVQWVDEFRHAPAEMWIAGDDSAVPTRRAV